jgi:hypothetical protein
MLHGKHLEGLAGRTMSRFLERYVRGPINQLIAEAPEQPLPEITARDYGNAISILISGEEIRIQRRVEPSNEGGDELPEDVPGDDPSVPL